MKKKRKSEMTLEQYKAKINKARKGIPVWDVMLHGNENWEQADNDYLRLQTLTNIAYILADVQDSCLLDANSIMKRYDIKMDKKAKTNFNNLKVALASANKHLRLIANRVDESHESQIFVCGMSDIFYDTCRMIMDRATNKKKIIKLVSLLRSMENYNEIFPELDHGRYTFNF